MQSVSSREPIEELSSVRFDFKQSSFPLRNIPRILSQEKQNHIDCFLRSNYSEEVSYDGIFETYRLLLTRYEGIRRRLDLPEDFSDQCESIYRILIEELSHNSKCLEVDPSKIVSASLTAGRALSSILSDERFSVFSDVKALMRKFAHLNRSDPIGRLETVLSEYAAILADPEFAAFGNEPWIVRHAVVGYPTTARDFLRDLEKTTSELLEREEFRLLAGRPGTVRRILAMHPKNREEHLRLFVGELEGLLRTPELELNGREWIGIYYLVNSKAPDLSIMDLNRNRREVLRDPRFCLLSPYSWFVERVLVHHRERHESIFCEATDIVRGVSSDSPGRISRKLRNFYDRKLKSGIKCQETP